MKAFEFSKKVRVQLEDALIKNGIKFVGIQALCTLQKYYGTKCKVHIFNTYIGNKIYAYYTDDSSIISYDNEEEAYKSILII